MHAEYMLVSNSDMADMALQVSNLMKEGWQAQGGIAVHEVPQYDSNGVRLPPWHLTEYVQAMVKLRIS